MSPARLSAKSRGILLYLTAIFFFALNDALGKWLVGAYGPGELLALRAVGAMFVLAPLMARSHVGMTDWRRWKLQVLRVIAMAADAFCFYYATRTMPLADVMTFYMASPLIVTAMSAIFLKERVEGFRWIAVGVGFVGVVIALQPSPAILASSSPLALFGAMMFGLGQTVTRRLRGTHWLQLVVWQFVGAGLIGAATLPWTWVMPTPTDFALLFLLGIVAMCCFICMTRALAIAPAAVLAPFVYSSMLWATIIGWVVWRDAPTAPIWIGNAVIIISGLFVLFRDREPTVALVD